MVVAPSALEGREYEQELLTEKDEAASGCKERQRQVRHGACADDSDDDPDEDRGQRVQCAQQ